MNICRVLLSVLSVSVDSFNIKYHITKLLYMKVAIVGACTHPGRNSRMAVSKPLMYAVSMHCQV